MGSSSAEESRKRAEDFIYSTKANSPHWSNSQKVFLLVSFCSDNFMLHKMSNVVLLSIPTTVMTEKKEKKRMVQIRNCIPG